MKFLVERCNCTVIRCRLSSSVTRVYRDKTVEVRIIDAVFTQRYSPMPYFFACQLWWRNSKGPLDRKAQTRDAWFLQRVRIACNVSVVLVTTRQFRLSVTCWYPIQMNKCKITRSTLWCRKNTLVFWHQQWLRGDVPFHLKFALKVTQPALKSADFDQYLLITSQP